MSGFTVDCLRCGAPITMMCGSPPPDYCWDCRNCWDGAAKQILLPGFYLQIVYSEDFRYVWNEVRWSDIAPPSNRVYLDVRETHGS